jgi:hypothetical protein
MSEAAPQLVKPPCTRVEPRLVLLLELVAVEA